MVSLSRTDLRRIFDNLDKNCDGHLCLEELNRLLKLLDFKCSINELESSVGKASLDFDEFLRFYESISEDDTRQHSEEEDCYNQDGDLVKAFNVFDLNGDGVITSEELRSVLLRLGLWDERSGTDCTSMIKAYDMNMDGQLDFQEFKNMMLLTIS